MPDQCSTQLIADNVFLETKIRETVINIPQPPRTFLGIREPAQADASLLREMAIVKIAFDISLSQDNFTLLHQALEKAADYIDAFNGKGKYQASLAEFLKIESLAALDKGFALLSQQVVNNMHLPLLEARFLTNTLCSLNALSITCHFRFRSMEPRRFQAEKIIGLKMSSYALTFSPYPIQIIKGTPQETDELVRWLDFLETEYTMFTPGTSLKPRDFYMDPELIGGVIAIKKGFESQASSAGAQPAAIVAAQPKTLDKPVRVIWQPNTILAVNPEAARIQTLVQTPTETESPIPSHIIDAITAEFGLIKDCFTGGQFYVFRVKGKTDKDLAVNVFKSSDPAFVDDSIRVARRVSDAKVNASPAVADMIRDIDTLIYRPRGLSYIISPWIEGTPLDKATESQSFSDTEIITIGRDLAGLLYFLHSQKSLVVVDLSPDNIILKPDGKFVVTDWGCSVEGRAMNQGDGKPAFASPEQYDDHSLMTPQVDVYALGVLLYFLRFRHGQATTPEPAARPLFKEALHTRFPGIEIMDPDLRRIIQGCTEVVYDRTKGSNIRMTTFEALTALQTAYRRHIPANDLFKF